MTRSAKQPRTASRAAAAQSRLTGEPKPTPSHQVEFAPVISQEEAATAALSAQSMPPELRVLVRLLARLAVHEAATAAHPYGFSTPTTEDHHEK